MKLVAFLALVISVMSACKGVPNENAGSKLEANPNLPASGNCVLLCFTDLKGDPQKTICKEQITEAECISQKPDLIKTCSKVRCIDREIQWVKTDTNVDDTGVPLGNCVLYAVKSDVVLGEVNRVPEKKCTLEHPNFRDALKLPDWGRLNTEWKPVQD
jgi:hypothetical protein